MRVLVCGDREWTDLAAILRELKHHRATVVIHGGARGADTLAGEAARQMKIPVEMFPAQWNLYGKSAGPIRNKQMLVEGEPDLVLAFHSDLMSSRGTRDMVRRADRAGVPFLIYEG